MEVSFDEKVLRPKLHGVETVSAVPDTSHDNYWNFRRMVEYLEQCLAPGPGPWHVPQRLQLAQLADTVHVQQQLGFTMVYVTHDQVEAMTMADKIVVLRDGRIEQVGSPLDLYRKPDNLFVAGFIGSPSMNFVEGLAGEGEVSVAAFGGVAVPTTVALPAKGEKVLVGLRPQHLKVSPAQEGAKVDLCEQLGGVAYSYLICPTGERVIVETKGEDAPVSDGTVASHKNSESLMDGISMISLEFSPDFHQILDRYLRRDRDLQTFRRGVP